MFSRPVVESIWMALATVMPPLRPSVVFVLACVDLRKMVPEPAAFECARLRVPFPRRVTLPEKVLFPERTSALVPLLMSAPEPLSTPERVWLFVPE